jgi:hypothetical protein
MKTYGEWRYSSTILDPGTRWRWVISFTPRPLCIVACASAVTITWRLLRHCLATGVFAQPFPSNGCLCWLPYSSFQQTCHSINYTVASLKDPLYHQGNLEVQPLKFRMRDLKRKHWVWSFQGPERECVKERGLMEFRSWRSWTIELRGLS